MKAMGDEQGMATCASWQSRPPSGRPESRRTARRGGRFEGRAHGLLPDLRNVEAPGAPVDWIYLNPVFANIHPIGIRREAPHPNAARLFMDFVLSNAVKS